MPKLVSIITPCYNGEKYLDKYFNSILAQTYPAIELIFINDGSTDNTEAIALDYGKKLEARGYRFIYIYQKNAGQSAAINQGLNVFKGDFLNWTDSDDYLSDDSVEKRVLLLEDNPEAGLIIGRTILVDDVNYRQIGVLEELQSHEATARDMIEDYLKGAFINPCCSTMVRTSLFKEAMNRHLQIEEVREIGQNYQLFIPVLFYCPVIFTPDILSYCVIHKDSHSHLRKTFEQRMRILDVAKDTLYSISDRINVSDNDRIWFKTKIAEYDCKKRLNVLQHYRRKDGLSELVGQLKGMGCYDSSARKLVLKIRFPFIKKAADYFWAIKKK